MKQDQSKIRLITGIVVNTIVSFNLIMPSFAFAGDKESRKARREARGKNRNTSFAGSIDAGTSLLNATGSIISQARENAQAQEQFNRLNLALTPVKVTNSYFPGCQTLPAMTPEVFQACKSPPRTGTQKNITLTIMQKAAENRRTYKEYSTIGNSRIANQGPSGSQNINNGMQCVQDRMDSTKQLLDQRVTGVTNMLNEMNKAKEELDASLQPQIDGLKELDAYLDGGNAINSNHTRKYANLFRQLGNDNHCSSVLDTVSVQNMASKGLNNINKEVNKIRTGNGNTDLVTNLLRNQGNIQASIRKYATDLQTTIKKRGIDRVSDNLLKGELGSMGINASMGLNSSPALRGAIQNQMRQFSDTRTDLQDRFSKLGMGSSTINNSVFGTKENNFSLKLKRWRDQKQDQCLRNKISTSKSENYDYFLSLIDHVDTRIRSKSNLGTLRNELKKHLDNNLLSIEEKVRKVQQILSRKNYRKVKIFSEDTDDANVTKGDKNPVAILNRYASACKDEYRRIEVNSEGQTFMEMEKEAKRIHNDFKDQERKIPSQIANSIYDRVINCRQDGEPVPYSLSSNSCNSDKLNLSSENFCLGQSVECAKTINACSQKVEDTIVRVTAQAGIVAKNINTQVESFVKFQKGLLNNLKQQAQAQSTQLEKIFRNSTFKLPDDLSLPQLEMSVGGLSNNHSTYDPEKLMQVFAKRMGELRNQIADQNNKVMAEMAKEQQVIAGNYQEQDGYWQELENRCEQMISQYNQAEQQRVAKVNEQRAEQKQELDEFCYSYRTYSRGPGCDERLDDLEETTRNVTGIINTGELQDAIGGVRGNCLKIQNEQHNRENGTYVVTDYKQACSGADQDIKNFPKTMNECQKVINGGNFIEATNITADKSQSIISAYQEERRRSNRPANSNNDRAPAGTVAFNAPVIPHCESINDYGTNFNSISSAIDQASSATLEFMTRQ